MIETSKVFTMQMEVVHFYWEHEEAAVVYCLVIRDQRFFPPLCVDQLV